MSLNFKAAVYQNKARKKKIILAIVGLIILGRPHIIRIINEMKLNIFRYFDSNYCDPSEQLKGAAML